MDGRGHAALRTSGGGAALPFPPIRAGLGSDVRTFWSEELKTVTSPYPTGPRRHSRKLIAMPRARIAARSFLHWSR